MESKQTENKVLVGLYENPTPADIEKINNDIEQQRNMEDGFSVVGAYDKDTPEEEKARILAKAALNREPTPEEIRVMLSSMQKADKAYAKRKAKRDAAKAEKARIKELLEAQGLSYTDFIGCESEIKEKAESIAKKANPPDVEADKIAEYIMREIKEAKQREGQRERRRKRQGK